MFHRLFVLYRPYILTIIRLLVGLTFVLHGAQKVFGIFGGPGLAGFAQYVTSTMGLPSFFAYTAAFVEFGAGLLLVLGLFTEYAALSLMPVMLVAIFGVHFKSGFFAQTGGYEYALNLLILLLVLVIGGAGKLTVVDVAVDRK